MTSLQELIAIRDGAPDGATHWDKVQYYRMRYNEPSLHVAWDVFNFGSGSWNSVGDMYLAEAYKLRSLSDISRQIELLEENDRLMDERDSILQEAKIHACELDTNRGIVQSIRDLFSVRVYDFNLIAAVKIQLEKRDLEQQAKGVDWVLACRELNLSEGEVSTIMERAVNLRQQAKEYDK